MTFLHSFGIPTQAAGEWIAIKGGTALSGSSLSSSMKLPQ